MPRPRQFDRPEPTAQPGLPGAAKNRHAGYVYDSAQWSRLRGVSEDDEMNKPGRVRLFLVPLVAIAAVLAMALPAGATHSWGGYHWARTANPFTLKLGDNVSAAWDGSLVTTSSDWSVSSVLDTKIVSGSTNPRPCKATSGRVEVCNAAYGGNGWLGVAQIWISGLHITQGTVKVNDTYFATTTYDTPAWRNLVMCQEVGHTLGLDHQDENFNNANLGTCMDYTNDPSTNQHPNAHDYEELGIIYAHLDSTTTLNAAPAGARGGFDTPGEWGRLVSGSEDPHSVAVYKRELGGGQRVVTFVIWAG